MSSSFEVWGEPPISRSLKRPSVTKASSLSKAPQTSYVPTASQEKSLKHFVVPNNLNGHPHSVGRSGAAAPPRRRDATVGGSGDNVSSGSNWRGSRHERTKPRQQSKVPVATLYKGTIFGAPSRPDTDASPAGFPNLHQSSNNGKDIAPETSPLPRTPTKARTSARDRAKSRSPTLSLTTAPSDPPPIPRAKPIGTISPRSISPEAMGNPLRASRKMPAYRRATIMTAVLSPSRSEGRPQSPPLSVKARAQALEKGSGEEEQRNFFRDPRLEATLSLIRSGQIFCQERHILVDFVRRAEPTTDGRVSVQPSSEVLRHALLLTSEALYLLEVEMLPHVHQSRHFHPNRAGETAATEALEHRSDAGHPGNCLSPVLPAARPAVGKAKVKSIKMVDRLQPSELQRVSLPFKEVTLRNGDIVARRSCGIVLHTRVEGRKGHVWLKCRSNQDRGALVDALVPWYETKLPDGEDLFVQQKWFHESKELHATGNNVTDQVAESSLAVQLARLAARQQRARESVNRPKDTDCILS